ncbi:acetyltransferase [Gracilaria domingensis]|nr:acetyltransferase [Gracilaria domingensis]
MKLAFAASHGQLFLTQSQPAAFCSSFHVHRVNRLASDAQWRSQPSRRCSQTLVVRAQRSVLPKASPTTAVQAPPELVPQRTSERRRELEQPTKPTKPARYRVREVDLSEVYTVADIRCVAFYEHPKDPYFYPVRRREIYMAMRDRIESGNKCLVVVDTQPPSEWLQFATDGELIVGSLDISLHDSKTGRKCQFLNSIFDRAATNNTPSRDGDPKRIYISSMAVREGWRGRGLAQLLLVHVDNIALRQGSEEVLLHVELHNKAAVHVYTKSGFQVVPDDALLRLPKWLHFITKAEHTLMQKKMR